MSLPNVSKAIGLFVLAFVVQFSFAQDRVISGKVVDAAGAPLSGVSVVAKGSSSGTQTNATGQFQLTVSSTVNTLVLSSVGFTTQEVSIQGVNTVSVVLASASTTMGDVVVVAYGTRRKTDLTGSVTAVTAKDFQKGNINSAEQLLVGKVAGLSITTGGGAAGGGSRIRIRGGASLNASNDPLLVIDGVPVDGNGVSGSANLLNTINPNDIESMTILKDASATALYGSRASNGVIIVTTKKGSKGAMRYNFSNTTSVGMITDYVDVLTADEIRNIVTKDAVATGNNMYKNMLGTANTDWQKEIYQAAIGADNTISATGSLGNIPFRASLGYLNQNGILKTNNFSRISTAINLSPKLLNDNLSLNVNVKASQTRNRFANEGAIGNAVSFDPTKPVLSGNNNWGGYYEWLNGAVPNDLSNRNPVALLMLRDNRSTVNRVIGNVQAEYKLPFFPDLKIQANVGMDFAAGSGNDNTDSVSATNYRSGGRRQYYEQQKVNQLADIGLFYAKEIKSIKSKIDVLVTHGYQSFLTKVSNFPALSYRAVYDRANPAKKDTIIGSEPVFLTDRPEYRLESYIGRLNYSLMDKYLITATIRSDASSKLNPDDRIGYFPSLALAWKAREDFFKNSTKITDFKIRFGWGVTGQQDGISYYSYLPRYTVSSNTAMQQFGNSWVNYLRPAGYDPSIRWETTTTTNLGVDYGFFNNRISGSVDYYKRKTKDLLANVAVASGANFVNEIVTNVGNISSEGVEVSLNLAPIRNDNVSWDINLNYTYNKATITNLLRNPDPKFKGQEVTGIGGGTGNTIGIHAVGYAPNSFYMLKQIYDQNGKPIEGLFEDTNRDGIINNDDRQISQKPAADVLLGFATSLSIKKFSFGIAGHGMLGNYLYNNVNSNNAVMRAIKNPVQFIGNATRDLLTTNFNNNWYLSDYYLDNASFFRIDNINFGYNAGRVFNDKATLRINASVQNVFVITKYNGLDPENAGDGGVDGNLYPRPRVYSLGFNLDF
ncbi:MAG: SusC/RagA family TonB-linked outer membrane protein [Chitinophagaceae bacterium]|nr:SusC/RagA family TonB-linked outer membrane protein [Chitinophagaceae bacterium]NDB52831.1 SusC/RagA family TonB-linked outer membrane protein [Chitinophagaceae bacterium]NDE77832.1 SusC/RagA family TonB-linked outer membrane protein [Chitinophagaceae bacterium]